MTGPVESLHRPRTYFILYLSERIRYIPYLRILMYRLSKGISQKNHSCMRMKHDMSGCQGQTDTKKASD